MNMVDNAISRKHSLITMIQPRMLGFKLFWDHYKNDLDFYSEMGYVA